MPAATRPTNRATPDGGLTTPFTSAGDDAIIRAQMHRPIVVAVAVLTLAAPSLGLSGAAARGPARTTAIFYYPWYGTPQRDGSYEHWDRTGHVPPLDLASSYYPARGPYSSSDPAVLAAQMREIAGAGIQEVVSSWWGVGSVEDERLPEVMAAAKAAGLRVAAQLEPYDAGRTPTSVAADIARLRSLGVTRIYVYRPFDVDPVSWLSLIHDAPGVQFFAQTANVAWAAASGFVGVYTYDVTRLDPGELVRLCARAHALRLLCAPSVGPGYDAERDRGERTVVPRRDGKTYDAMWAAAIAAKPDLVTITSYNEWHEGTQIEPALTPLPRRLSAAGGRPGYETYEGAYGLEGKAAERAYLTRTAYWTKVFGSSPAGR